MIDRLDLEAFVDGELSDQEAARIRAAIESDESLKSAVLSLQAYKEALPTKAIQHQDPELWKQVQGRLGELKRVNRVEKFISKNALQLCGALGVLIIGAGLLNRQPSVAVSPGDVSAYASAVNPTSLPGDLGNWFKQKIGSVPVETEHSPLRPLRVFEGFNNGSHFLYVILTDGNGELTLIVVPDKNGFEGFRETIDKRYRIGMMNGQNCVGWISNGYAVMLMGNRESIQIQSIADSIRR